MPRHRHSRKWMRLSTAFFVVGGSVLALETPSFAAGSFTAGDLVVYEVQGTSSSSFAVDLVDYSTGGVPSGFSVALPIADSSPNHALTESGSALNDGELTLSADGQSLIATGYDAAPGVTSITGSTVPRTVALVSPTGTVDTTTALSDGTAEGNNFRSATTAVTGGNIYVGSGGGTGITTDSGTSATYLDASKTHEVQVVNGQLYESTSSAINQVGTGLPTSGTPTLTSLITGANLPAHFGPDQFAFVTLGAGPGPDTLYVADGSNGATSGDPSAVEKYSLVSGVWKATGSITVPLVVGLTATASGGVAHIYVTGATATSASNNTILDGITDSSGYDGTLSGSATLLATAPSGTDFKGLAFAPVATGGEGLPETPFVLALPVLGALLLGGYLALRRRSRATDASA
ncbi:MAG: hypothetical protein ABSC30_12025 [Acidimicrobiales bacterium]